MSKHFIFYFRKLFLYRRFGDEMIVAVVFANSQIFTMTLVHIFSTSKGIQTVGTERRYFIVT